LRSTIENQLKGSDTVLIGTPMEYGIYHQDAKDEKRRREFLGYSVDNIAELQDAVDEFMKEHVS
jgi:phage gpG-like protein